MRIFAKVPRIMTSWLPRRVPYWLKSLGSTPWSSRYFPAGEFGRMLPAGEMWSVVIESPKSPRIRALTISSSGRGSLVNPAPAVVPREHIGIARFEELARDRAVDEILDLGRARPDVAQVYRLPVGA